MRLLPWVLFTLVSITLVHAAEPPAATEAGPAPKPRPRPHVVSCSATVNVLVEVDSSSLPAREPSIAESKKRVSLHLVDSSPARGDSVVCSYATRSRDITTSYSVRCVQPHKERGRQHSYICM